MSMNPVSVNFPSLNTKHAVTERRTANFRPSVWGDYFIQYALDDNSTELDVSAECQRIKELVTEVEVVFAKKGDKYLEMMDLIDQLRRLGIAYHFETKIAERLGKIYENSRTYFEMCGKDLHATALLFRLLRQQGYRISCKVFDKFKDGDHFRESLHSDMRGLLSLYEASHLMVRQEDILEEALSLTTTHLESIEGTGSCNGNDLLLKQVRRALEQPIHKGLPRLEARHYIPIYKDDPSHDEGLLALAVLDFNSQQEQHQKELGSITRWWKRLDFSTKLPFARDRIVECYFWILGVFFEPEFVLTRRILTKVISLTSVMDDIYDVHGTMEELEIFTRAIGRWDRSAADELPEYMKVFYEALLDVYSEIHDETNVVGQGYRHKYAVQAMKDQANAYFEEAKWFHRNYTPTMEEYMPVAMVSSGYYLLLTISFVCMGEIASRHAFEWLFNKPKMVEASTIVTRLMDDIVSHKFEQTRGHVASAVECYQKEHNISQRKAEEELKAWVFDAWKDINEGCLLPTEVAMPLIVRILNLTRVLEVIYKDEDNYTNVGTKFRNYVKSMLVEPLTM